MKQTLILIISIIYILIGTSCLKNEHNTTYAKLKLADFYMTIKPEITLQILDSLNHTSCIKDHYFALLYSQAKYRNYIHAENDSLIKIALAYYAHSNDSTMKSRAYLVAAQIYDELENNTDALHYIHLSATAASKSTDYWTKSFIQYEWGRLLRDAWDIDTSTEKFELSLKYAKELQDTIQIISRLRELCYNYLAKSNFEQSLTYINEGIDLANKINSYRNLSMLYSKKSLVFYYFGNYYEALRYINKAITYNSYLGRHDSLSNLNFKGRLLTLTGQLDSAKYYIEQGRDTSTLANANLYYECMQLLHEARNDYKGALNYCKLYSDNLLKIASNIEKDKIAQLDKQYKSERIEKENHELKIKQQQSMLYSMGIVIVVVMAAFGTYVAVSRRQKRLIMTMHKQREDIDQLMQHKVKADKLETALATDIKNKGEKLDAAKKLIADLKYRQFMSCEVVKKVFALAKAASNPKRGNNHSEPLTDIEIQKVIAAVDECYDNFVDNMKQQYPELIDSEIYLCCLIKMGIDNCGLCAVLDISDSTLRKRKYRLKSTKFDPTGQFDSLDDALRNI